MLELWSMRRGSECVCFEVGGRRNSLRPDLEASTKAPPIRYFGVSLGVDWRDSAGQNFDPEVRMLAC